MAQILRFGFGFVSTSASSFVLSLELVSPSWYWPVPDAPAVEADKEESRFELGSGGTGVRAERAESSLRRAPSAETAHWSRKAASVGGRFRRSFKVR